MQNQHNLSESDIEREESFNDNLCRTCEQAEIDQSESPNSVLCPACREKLIRYPIPKIFIVFTLIIIILIGVSFFHFPEVLGCYKMYENSVNKAENGEISEALNDLNTVIEQYPDSIDVATRLTDIAMSGGYYDVAANTISQYLMEKEMDTDTVDRINQYIDKLEAFYTSYDAITEMQSKLDPSLSPEEFAQAMVADMKDLLNDPKQDKALLYYYLSLYDEDANSAKSDLEQSIKEDDNFVDAKVQLGTLLRRQGDLSGAEKLYNEALSEDKSYSGTLRGLAIVKLLQNDKQEGLDYAYKAYQQDPDGMYIWETYVIALKENDKKSDMNNMVKEYLDKENQLDADTQDYLEGKVSLHDYYISE